MAKRNSTNRNLELLYEIGCLRFIDRSWQRFLNADFQNLAEHHLRVTWLALVLAKEEGVSNTDKIMKMAIVHDLGESRTGDADYLSRQYVKRDEEMAVKDILKDTAVGKEFLKLWSEYEKHDSIEAKIVKDADILDVDLELQEQLAKGNPIKKEWNRELVVKNQLSTKSAKKIWKEIQTSNPHSWHTSGRNRYIGGDWKRLKTTT